MNTALEEAVRNYTERMLAAYGQQPLLVDEHAGLEENISQGGYGRRQIHELVQNGADELIGSGGGRIHVVQTEAHLYCANEGTPITPEGIAAILLANVSPKRGDEIGRFGLGFKSVLGVTSRPEFFSEPVSFGFDGDWASEQIEAVAGPHDAYPTLRTAQLLDRTAECDRDPTLKGLLEWATTVVRLPLERGADWLQADLESFNEAFLLFSPHVSELRLECRTSGLDRRITMATVGDDLELSEGDHSQRWRVFSTELRPTEEALRSAGKLQHRDVLPVVWAVPVEGRLEVGQFWAFFPLRDQTTLSGIANAPWQVNDDRTGLLENSVLNRELIGALVELVFASFDALLSESDPGRVLDLMPGRGREARCWGDAELTSSFNRQRTEHRVVPDQDARLRRITSLKAGPTDVPVDAHRAWSSQPVRPTNWVHPSAYTSPTRKSRITDMLEASGRPVATAAQWLEALVADDDAGPDESAQAIRVAGVAASDDEFDQLESGLCDAHVVLNDGGDWSRLHPDWIWTEPADSSRPSSLVLVSPDVVDLEGVREALTTVGITDATPLLEFEALLSEAERSDSESWDPESWDSIWTVGREIENPDDAVRVLRRHLRSSGPFYVRTVDGGWHASNEVLLPGRVLDRNSESGMGVLVDDEFHADDMDVLRGVGLSDGPTDGGSVDDDPRTQRWRKEMLDAYERRLNAAGARPQSQYLVIDRGDVPRPIGVVARLAGDANARFVELLLAIPRALTPRRMRHRTSTNYPQESCESPTTWAVRKWGYLRTSLPNDHSDSNARRVSEAVGPSLREFERILPVAEVADEAAAALVLPALLADVPQTVWEDSFAVALRRSPEHLGELLEVAVQAEVPPLAPIRMNEGDPIDLADIVVATPRDNLELLENHVEFVALVSDPAVVEVLVERWGLRPANDLVHTRVVPVQPAEPIAVTDVFPDLLGLDPDLAELSVVCCEELVIETSSDEGSTEESHDSVLESGVLYVDTSPEDLRGILGALVERKGYQLTPSEREQIIEDRHAAANRKRRNETERATSLEEKVVLAIGREPLMRGLPKPLLEAMAGRSGGHLSDLRVGELALAVHGVEVLEVHKHDLAQNGLQPPSRWAGGQAARRFVLDLGFPREFAGFEQAPRDPLLDVAGPPNLHPLHDFQRGSADRIRELVRAGSGRGMLSLPTGAGKTRTAVQALVESIRDRDLEGPILWVAQTDELCEQAVTSWAESWRAFGPSRTMRLSRLWSSNEVQNLEDPHQVVVATIAKLNRVIGQDRYDWVSKAGAIVIDEAHRALSPDYTKLLDWLGMGRGKERAPLIGLSATPYRGVSQEQTQSLVNRFKGNRLDDIGDNPYGLLQEMEVLARVEHQLLAGSNLTLHHEELAALKQTRLLPKSVLERVGRDRDRNQTILDSIKSLDDDFTVLLFAASVQHAELLAGLLSAEGIPSRAISSRTGAGARHHYISQFRDGEIRVLTNFGVLTEGFDAPAVRAVYVARPTYSPNLYQQMIGRGLRGRKNGGKELCLIVNVADNLAEYGEKLAFEEWDHLWTATDTDDG